MNKGTSRTIWEGTSTAFGTSTGTEGSTVISLAERLRKKQQVTNTSKDSHESKGVDEMVFSASTTPLKIDLPVHVNKGEKVTVKIERTSIETVEDYVPLSNKQSVTKKTDSLRVLELHKLNSDLQQKVEELVEEIKRLKNPDGDLANDSTVYYKEASNLDELYVKEPAVAYESNSANWTNVDEDVSEESNIRGESVMYNELIVQRDKIERSGIICGLVLSVLMLLIPLLTPLEWKAVFPGILMFLSLTVFMLIRKKVRGSEDD
ncbi:hypothetical protein [Bacillus cereus group sp. BY8-1LC]|uniref:hypothetical protein n=1 Tax=Bacillus cereus group sp. BY8-1LC TaxID=3018076 RepID=UPI0022E551F2|nr:hypothetical protein [Bacillus cereus group sp. BY8-1LC]MDA1797571.1 hypothetical protein [Bacillus cereus group sp. BY8-1LC]